MTTRKPIANIAQRGDVYGPEPEPPETEAPAVVATFSEIVEQYEATYVVTDLEVTTRRGYRQVGDRARADEGDCRG